MSANRELYAPRRRRWGKTAGPPEVRRFLAGPQPRLFELVRAIRIFIEFIRGFRRCISSGRASPYSGRRAFPRRIDTMSSHAAWVPALRGTASP